jgi:predicted O-methyltransferase YrrM
VDNVVRNGEVVAERPDASAAAMRETMAWMAAEPRLSATAIQTVGSKGYDGFAIALVN